MDAIGWPTQEHGTSVVVRSLNSSQRRLVESFGPLPLQLDALPDVDSLLDAI